MKIHFSDFFQTRKIVLSISGIAALLVAVYLAGGSYSIYHPVPFNEPVMSQAVHWVRTHGNQAQLGAVALPPQFALVSATGKAYVGDSGVIFFPSWMGRKTLFSDPLDSERDNIEGYGFSPLPLPTEESEPDGSTRFFLMLDFADPPHPATTGATGPEMAVSRCLKPHWYAIGSFS